MKHVRYFLALLIMCSMAFTAVSCVKSKEDKAAEVAIKVIKGELSDDEGKEQLIKICGSEEEARELAQQVMEREDVKEAIEAMEKAGKEAREKAIDPEDLYTYIEHEFLGEAIRKEAPSAKKIAVLLDSNNFFDEWGDKRVEPLKYPAYDGLMAGLGSGVEIIEIMPEVKKIKKPSDPNAMPPKMGMMINAKSFKKCFDEAKAKKADVFVCISMLPPEMRLGQVAKSMHGMKVALANCGYLDVLPAVFADGGKTACELIAVVTSKANAIYDETIPSNEEKAFNRRYTLITKSNYQTAVKEAQAK